MSFIVITYFIYFNINELSEVSSIKDSSALLSSTCKIRCSYITDKLFLKLGNLKAHFNISAKHDIFIPIGSAKYAVH